MAPFAFGSYVIVGRKRSNPNEVLLRLPRLRAVTPACAKPAYAKASAKASRYGKGRYFGVQARALADLAMTTSQGGATNTKQNPFELRRLTLFPKLM